VQPGSALSLRDEKILLTLVVQTQQLNDRLTRLEDRFEASVRDALSQPDQRDLLELRLHSARLAAELSRVTVELRAEINELAKGATDTSPPLNGLPVTAEADEILDLRDPAASPRAPTRRASGWRPARPKHPPTNDS
jgi:hypothetical protein